MRAGERAVAHRHPRRAAACLRHAQVYPDLLATPLAALFNGRRASGNPMRYTHTTREQLGLGVRTLLGRALGMRGQPATEVSPVAPILKVDEPGPEVAREFHRRMSAIIESVQVSIWERGVRELLGYSTDFALGQARGVQTLVLKTRGRSSYLRVHWDTLMSDAPDERARVDALARSAVQELS